MTQQLRTLPVLADDPDQLPKSSPRGPNTSFWPFAGTIHAHTYTNVHTGKTLTHIK